MNTKGIFPVLALGLLGALNLLGSMIVNLLGHAADYNPFDFTNDPFGSLLVILGLVLIILFAILLAARAIPAHPKSIGGIMAVIAVLLLGGFFVMSTVNLPTGSVANAPSAASLTSYLTTTIVPSGCSVVQSTNTETCNVVYNYTASQFYTCASNASAGATRTACALHNYIVVSVHSARTDTLNATYGFTYQEASVATVVTTGSTPTVYSPCVGYVPATSTASGIWKAYWSQGSQSTLNPTQAAPSVTTGWTPSLYAINSFGSATQQLHLSLPGSNSTSAPAAMYAAMTLYTSYSFTFTVGNSTPSTFTLTIVLLGESS